MTKINWTINTYDPITSSYTNITTKVLSLNIRQGREKYLDSYSSGTLSLTINNASNYAANIEYGDQISAYGLIDLDNIYNNNFWVQEITFTDYPGNTGLNTATITAVDWLGAAGRIQATNFTLNQTGTCQQFETNFPALLPTGMNIATGFTGSSIAAATTYTGSILNYLNFLAMTERGIVYQYISSIYFLGRGDISSLAPAVTSIGPTVNGTLGSYQIAYSNFNRYQNGAQFINTATTTPNGLAAQTSTNATSVSTYGPAFYSVSTVDYNTTQALGNSNWIVNNFSDQSTLYFSCEFNDLMQNEEALKSLNFWYPVRNFKYSVPGGSSVTVPIVVEGYEINVTPEQTTFRLSMSPLQYYQFFTLNSSTLGILDTSRLGW
jgi:hypothetical protein